MSVKVNPKGARDHDHSIRAKVNHSSIYQMEQLLGDRHSTGIVNKMTAEWYLVTDHGSVTVNDWWALNEGEFHINAANDRAALLAVDYFRRHGLQAYSLTGAMT